MTYYIGTYQNWFTYQTKSSGKCVLISNLLKVLNIIIYVNDRALLIKRYDVGSKKNEKWQRLMSKYVLWWGLQNWHWKNTIYTRESDSKINLSYRHFLLAAYYFWPKWFPSLLCWPITLCSLYYYFTRLFKVQRYFYVWFFFFGAYTFSKFKVPRIAARKE